MSKANVKLTTPKGVAVYPRLSSPDTKFHDLGIYKADVKLSVEDATPFMKKLGALYKDWMGKAPPKKDNTMWKYEEDKETGEETGFVVFKIRVKNRMKANGELWDRKPNQFDAMGNAIAVNIGGGTVMRASVEVYFWTAGAKKGVSLQPLAVQVIDLHEFGGGGNASSFGFEAEEGGFEMSNGASQFEDNDETTEDEDY